MKSLQLFQQQRSVFCTSAKHFALFTFRFQAVGISYCSPFIYIYVGETTPDCLLSKHHQVFQMNHFNCLPVIHMNHTWPQWCLERRIFHVRQMTEFQTFSDVPLPAVDSLSNDNHQSFIYKTTSPTKCNDWLTYGVLGNKEQMSNTHQFHWPWVHSVIKLRKIKKM